MGIHMSIDWLQFTPWTALAGGGLIGLSAGLLVTGLGRIAGISGIFAAMFQSREPGNGWRWAFILGLLLSPWLLQALTPEVPVFPEFEITHPRQWLVLAVAGLLVGYGTRMANGCTSGHGVCGLARLSPRSLAAVSIFMGSAMVTVALRHLLGGAS